MTTFFTAPRIVAGPGAIEQLSALDARRAALVVDPGLASSGRHRRIVEELGKTDTTVEVFLGEDAEPTIRSAEAVSERVRSFAPDWVVAFGGGRTIDLAKAAWVRYRAPEIPLESVTPLTELGLRSVAGFVAVPTTSGSGCDASWTALLRAEDGRPIEIASRELVPDWTLLDPSYPSSMTPRLTAETGIELTGHALEAIASEWSSPFSDALARDALGTAFDVLPRAVKHPDDLDARASLHYAATMAGVASSNSQFGAAHALAVALGGRGGAPYGRLLGTLLPYITEFNYPSAREKYGRLAQHFGPSAGRDRSAISERLRAWSGPLGIPRTLGEAGLDRDSVLRERATVVGRARASSASVANPRVPSDEEYGRLLEAAFDGTPVGF